MGRYGLTMLFAAVFVIAGSVFVTVHPRPQVTSQAFVPVSATTASHTYCTWDTMEFDKCAAAWMIRRFIDKDAVFQFHPQGERSTEGTPLDVPGAQWARTARQCATEAVLKSAGIDDPALQRIAEMAHLVEIGKWYIDSDPEARRHFEAVGQIIDETPDPAACIDRTTEYFGRFYESLSSASSKPQEGQP